MNDGIGPAAPLRRAALSASTSRRLLLLLLVDLLQRLRIECENLLLLHLPRGLLPLRRGRSFADPPDPHSLPRSIDDVPAALAEISAMGITEIDCAIAYSGGKSEEALGLAGYEDFVLSSKTMWATLGYDNVISDMAKTKAALQTDCLDIYYLHSPDPSTELTPTLR